jgi:hypothetical protein
MDGRADVLKALVAGLLRLVVWHLLADPTSRSTTSAADTTAPASTRRSGPATTSGSSKALGFTVTLAAA